MITKFLVITGQTKQVLQSHGRSGKKITLHSDPVSIATGHLDDRLNTFGFGDQAGTDTGHPHDGCLTVGNIDGINISFKDSRLFSDHFRVTAFGRPQLTGNGKLAAGKHPLQITP